MGDSRPLTPHMRTWVRVSGRRSPTSPPHTSTVEANRMGKALVMPTREPKVRFPSTAATLHNAFRKPKPVVLQGEDTGKVRLHSYALALHTYGPKDSFLCAQMSK